MRINILAVAATIQLSSLSFASANKCRKSLDDYHCGAGYQEDGYFDINPDTNECICCCRSESGDGFHENTCDGGNIKSSDKGCGSCMGEKACNGVSDSKIGDKSCVHRHSCKDMKKSFIKEYSCRHEAACEGMERTHVGTHSCGIGTASKEEHILACNNLWDSTVGDESCQENQSCNGFTKDNDHDHIGTNVKIGNNACNMELVCYNCENYSVVPDGACNGDNPDTYINKDGNKRCNYCSVSCTILLVRAPSLCSTFITLLLTPLQTYSPHTTVLHRLHSTLPRVQAVAAV